MEHEYDLPQTIDLGGFRYNCLSIKPWGNDWSFLLVFKTPIRFIYDNKKIKNNKHLKELVNQYKEMYDNH